jgi:cell division ATPase FtsA
MESKKMKSINKIIEDALHEIKDEHGFEVESLSVDWSARNLNGDAVVTSVYASGKTLSKAGE